MTSTPEGKPEVPDELRDFVGTLPNPRSIEQPQFIDNVWKIALQAPREPIDLTAIPARRKIRIDLEFGGPAPNSVEIKNLAPARSLLLHVAYSRDVKLRLAEISGDMDLTAKGSSPANIKFEPSCVGTVRFHTGSFTPIVTDDTSMKIESHSGSKIDIAQNLPAIEVHGASQLNVAGSGKVDKIMVANDATVTVNRGNLNVGEITAESPSTELTLIPHNPNNQSAPEVRAKKIYNITLVAEPGKQGVINVTDSIRRTTIRGRPTISLRRSATAEELQSSDTPTLNAARGAVITGLGGEWNLDNVAGAHLRGAEGGFEIVSDFRSAKSDPMERLRGVVLIRFRLTDSIGGRELLKALGEAAYHIDPDPTGLPGSDARYKKRLPIERGLDSDQQRNLPADTEFVRELARVARDKGAPGSTRTRITWCAYRLRHLSSTSWWERRALDGYRLLGYGERPGPAFLTWIAIAALSAALSLGIADGAPLEVSAQGLGTYMASTAEHALGPVGALFRTGLPKAENWEYALRALVAIPLVTGALALRSYVKHGDR